MRTRFVDCFLLMGSALSLRGDQSLSEAEILFRQDVVDVNVTTTLLDMRLNDPKTMEVQVEFLLDQQWVDRRLSADEGTQRLATTGKVWSPKLTAVVGTVEVNEDAQFWRGTSPDGHVLLSVKLLLTTHCTTDFWRAPFDTQYCHLKIGSYRFPDDEIRLLWGRRQVETRTSKIGQFHLDEVITYTQVDRRLSGNFTVLVVRLRLRRATSRFLFSTFTPPNLLAAATYLTFWMHPRNINFRLAGAGLTLFVSLYHLLHHLQDEFKLVDVYVTTTVLFIITGLIENMIVDYYWMRTRVDEFKDVSRIRLDYYVMVLYPLLFIGVNVLYVLSN